MVIVVPLLYIVVQVLDVGCSLDLLFFSWSMGWFEACSSCQMSYGVYSYLIPRTYLSQYCIIPYVLGLVTGIYNLSVVRGSCQPIRRRFSERYSFILCRLCLWSPVLFWDVGCYESGTCPRVCTIYRMGRSGCLSRRMDCYIVILMGIHNFPYCSLYVGFYLSTSRRL